MKKLIVLGSSNIDYILNVPHFLAPGETLSGTQYQVALGGKGANQAVAAGRAGANIQFISAVGNDPVGKDALEQFKKDHINISAIEAIKNENTGVALIFVNNEAENMIGIYPGANAHITKDYIKPYIKDIQTCNLLLMQLEIPIDTIMHAATEAKKSGACVVLNPAPAQSLSDKLLCNIDIITPNETEAKILTGIEIQSLEDADHAAKFLHKKGIPTVIITLGKQGAWVSHNQHGKLIEGFSVNAIDTIAAGDTFNGVLATALLEDMSLDDAVLMAHAAAAISVTRKGAQPSVPLRAEIDQFLKENIKQ